MRRTATEDQPELAARWWLVRVSLLIEVSNADDAIPRIDKRLRLQRIRVLSRLSGDRGAVVAGFVLSKDTAGRAVDEAVTLLHDTCAAEGVTIVGLHEASVTPGEEVGFGWGEVEP